MPRRVLPLVLLLALVLPAGAVAQSSPFDPLPPAQNAPEPAPAPASSSDGDGGGLKGWQEALIIAAGVILVLGIGWVIVADARSHAPTGDATPEREEARSRREVDLKRRKQKTRAATKRSREARKRNRNRNR